MKPKDKIDYDRVGQARDRKMEILSALLFSAAGAHDHRGRAGMVLDACAPRRDGRVGDPARDSDGPFRSALCDTRARGNMAGSVDGQRQPRGGGETARVREARRYVVAGAELSREEIVHKYLHLVKYVAGRISINLPPNVEINEFFFEAGQRLNSPYALLALSWRAALFS